MNHNRHKLIKKIKHYFNVELRDYQTHLSNDFIEKGLIFRAGFEACLDCVKSDPINPKELQELLFKETIRFIVKLIEECSHKN